MRRRFVRHLAASLVCATLFLPLATLGAEKGFEWKDLGDGKMELRENGAPALVYNYGPQLKQGAPKDRKRCCYVFPLYTPGGVSMLDDFPADHWHHRGVHWAWPVVETEGKTYDHWMRMTALNHPEGIPVVTISSKQATLQAKAVWKADGNAIVRESVRLSAMPSTKASREFDVEVTLEALKAPVTLKGSREKGKSYGGFNARFAARENTVLRADGNVLAEDEDLNPRQWAELEGTYGGKRVALRITPSEKNPGVPYQWCLRHYGYVGASFPGRTETSDGYTLQPGKPLTLTFRVKVSDIP